ncbi:MAG: alanine dehydrogenase [Gammaproteobacteria bacterium]|nr:alanine dehydrogenase [Gammaproteobacteria bacterium]MCD8542800.1 alanine dehydrogenase [Gammaproteobacteria bacterium]
MLIGVPKEIKSQEFRVGLTPSSVGELIHSGHQVIVEKNAGSGIGLDDESYRRVGAVVVDTAEEIFTQADMIVKVKEPQPNECRLLRPGQILFTYLHLAPDTVQTELLLESGCIAIAYETVSDHHGRLPLLSPMSEVAGRMSIQAAAKCLEMVSGGKGLLLGGVVGVPPTKILILGGGVVGSNALRVAVGMEADVTLMDVSLDRMREIDTLYGANVKTVYPTKDIIAEYISKADVVIGAVLLPGAAAPRLVTREMVGTMSKGSVLIDVAIDQGGCFETSQPTTHEKPVYLVDGVVHYCVANMPAGVAKTSTYALNNATLPFVLSLANKGHIKALQENVHLLNGLNIYEGQLTCEAVARAQHKAYTKASTIFE